MTPTLLVLGIFWVKGHILIECFKRLFVLPFVFATKSCIAPGCKIYIKLAYIKWMNKWSPELLDSQEMKLSHKELNNLLDAKSGLESLPLVLSILSHKSSSGCILGLRFRNSRTLRKTCWEPSSCPPYNKCQGWGSPDRRQGLLHGDCAVHSHPSGCWRCGLPTLEECQPRSPSVPGKQTGISSWQNLSRLQDI